MPDGTRHRKPHPPISPAVALQDYVDARMADHAHAHAREHEVERQASKEARDTLSSVMQARFDGVNEFRKVLGDQAVTFMPRDSFDRQHQALADKLELRATSLGDKLDQRSKSLSDRVDAVEEQATRSAIIVGVVSALIGLLAGALIVPILTHFASL